MKSAKDFIRILTTIAKTLRKSISYDEEFKIRVIKWKENPYIFSDFSAEICGPIYNFAILDSDGKIIDTPFE